MIKFITDLVLGVLQPRACRSLLLGVGLAAGLAGCASVEGDGSDGLAVTPEAPAIASDIPATASMTDGLPQYLIGPYDRLEVFVWRAEELSTDVTVRPDGRISTPLVQDMMAAGKTPSDLATDLEEALATYVRQPRVNVIVREFSSTFDQQVRVLGEAQNARALPYQMGMTVLDVMLGVGGLTEFAAGNRAKLIRGRGEDEVTYRLRLHDLMRRGDVSANVQLLPGDVILIPESRF